MKRSIFCILEGKVMSFDYFLADIIDALSLRVTQAYKKLGFTSGSWSASYPICFKRQFIPFCVHLESKYQSKVLIDE